MIMFNDFKELSATEMKSIDGGSFNWEELGIGIGNSWLRFWEGVGEKIYDALHKEN